MQDSLAKFWEAPAGTPTSTGIWNDEALRLVNKYRVNARRAAHLLALLNAISFDGLVATSDAKFTYWLLRPIMADSAITLAAAMPNHPSYPSNLATISGGIAEILAVTFPAERSRLEALASEAALSRVYGGIHFPFDSDEGLKLGRRIAAWVLGHDPGLGAPIPLD
jgi:hypothetical protein